MAEKFNSYIIAVFIDIDYVRAYDRIIKRGYRFIPLERIKEMESNIDEPFTAEGFNEVYNIEMK